jgi:hypothetical protein
MSGPFNMKNWFGQRCAAAIIPGWGDVHAFGDSDKGGSFSSIGQRFVFTPRVIGLNNTGGQTITTGFGHMGTVRAYEMNLSLINATNYHTVSHDNGSGAGFEFKDNQRLSCVAIYRPEGDGRGGLTPDPRIFSQDDGYDVTDHDLMVGIAASGNEGRCRVRVGGNVITVLSGTAIQDNSINMTAAVLEPNAIAGRTDVKCRHLREDGGYFESQVDNNLGEYDPRTGMRMGIGGTQQTNTGNHFSGEVLGVWFFDDSLRETHLRQFFANPWQVFAPQRIVTPVSGGRRVIEVQDEGPATSVLITDVNGTESWTDGNTGLIITGTGFV